MAQVFSPHRTWFVAMAMAVLTCAVAFSADDASGKTFMWKATSPTTTIYLLGALHQGSDALYPLAAEIDAAFAESKYLVVEVDFTTPESSAKSGAVLGAKAYFPPGEKLSDKISAASAARLKAFCEKRGLPIAQINKLRPWFFGFSITFIEAQKTGLTPEQGIDKHFIERAKSGKKQIKELDTIDGQLQPYYGMSDELQEKFLVEAIELADSTTERMGKIVTAWKSGDDAVMNELMIANEITKHPDCAPIVERIFYSGNVTMADKIDGYLKGNEKHFVVVGAGHVGGDRGILSLLRKKGYLVEQVNRGEVTENPQSARRKGATPCHHSYG